MTEESTLGRPYFGRLCGLPGRVASPGCDAGHRLYRAAIGTLQDGNRVDTFWRATPSTIQALCGLMTLARESAGHRSSVHLMALRLPPIFRHMFWLPAARPAALAGSRRRVRRLSPQANRNVQSPRIE